MNCNGNLRGIDAAKEQAARELGLTNGDLVAEGQVAKYCKAAALPKCPSGGKYTVNPVGYRPTCSRWNPSVPDSWHHLPAP